MSQAQISEILRMRLANHTTGGLSECGRSVASVPLSHQPHLPPPPEVRKFDYFRLTLPRCTTSVDAGCAESPFTMSAALFSESLS
jgi:hypothetical protein